MTSDGGFLAYRELDDALDLLDSIYAMFTDKRTGNNIQHAIYTISR